MKLSFLGKTYEAFTPAIEATELNETATFLGKSYVRKQYNLSQRQQPKSELVYRGIKYAA